MIIICRSRLKLGQVGSKIRLLGQILEKPCVHCTGHIFNPKFTKLGHVGSKTRSIGQILEKPCVHSRRHSFDPSFMKLCQNVNHYIKVKFETGSCWVKN